MRTAVSDAIDFLLDGDPAIRWQAMRDLQDAPAVTWQAERARVAVDGWGAQFLSHQNSDGGWPRARWTDSVWTMVTLVELGMLPDDDRLTAGFEKVIGWIMPKGQRVSRDDLLKRLDLCHLAFYLRIGSRFCPQDERLPELSDVILRSRLKDGAWNCRIRMKPKTCHSSFHTTFNVLDGLREAAEAGVVSRCRFDEVEAEAVEFMLQHKMYRSDKTGEIVSDRFLDLTYPSHWHYTVLRGLDYIQGTPFIADARLDDALSWLETRRKPGGRWPVEKRIPGVTLFDMEKMGQDSRWNTLRALRVLRRRAQAGA